LCLPRASREGRHLSSHVSSPCTATVAMARWSRGCLVPFIGMSVVLAAWASAESTNSSESQAALASGPTGEGFAAATAANSTEKGSMDQVFALSEEVVTFSGRIQWTNFPSKCIDVRDGVARNGVRLQLWDCLSTSESQLFTWSSSDKMLRWAAHPEFCVDIRDKRSSNGNFLQLWHCGAEQSFDVPRGGIGKIAWSAHSDKCTDVRDHAATNGNDIQIWDCQASNSDQSFTFGTQEGSQPQQSASDDGEAFDIIVIGGGLVGSVVAAEMAARLPQMRVLLIEAGKASQAILGGKDPPASWKSGWKEWPGMSGSGLTRYDVPGNYEALQCWHNDCDESWGRSVPAFQCRVLGGCGVMNGALMQVPNEANFDAWPAGWKFGDLQRHFQAAQSLFHITTTPSRDEQHYLDKAGADFVRMSLERGGYTMGSTLHPKPKVMGKPQVSAKDGVRQSTTSELLPRAKLLSNFELMLETEVLHIVHRGGTAEAVTVKVNEHDREAVRSLRLKANGLVVVSAGALNTPRLLLASGVTGSGSVGEGVSDHTLQSMVYDTTGVTDMAALAGVSMSFSLSPVEPDVASQYVSSRSGPLAQYGPTLIAFIRHPSSLGPPEAVDVEVWVNPVTKAGEAHVSIVLMRPTCSSARVHLEGSRLMQRGSMRLSCSRDREIMDFAIAELDHWFGKLGAKRISTRSPVAMNHFAGSCALGRCASPTTLRVSGTTNIAVADASLLPEQVWGHPALTLTALGYKAAEVLTGVLV